MATMFQPKHFGVETSCTLLPAIRTGEASLTEVFLTVDDQDQSKLLSGRTPMHTALSIFANQTTKVVISGSWSCQTAFAVCVVLNI